MQFYVTQTQDNIHKYVNISRIRPLRISHLNINIRTSIPITPCLGLITFTGVGDQLGYLSWSLPHLRAKSCSAQLTFPSVILFRLPVAYLICLPTLTVCRLPLTPPCLAFTLSPVCRLPRPFAFSPFTIQSLYDIPDAVTRSVPVWLVVPLIKLFMDPNATDSVLQIMNINKLLICC